MTATEYVILVDENDNETGTAEKLAAHEKNQRHRAFSIFIFRRTPRFELLLQQRALGKYHSPGLWTNSCCGHPRPGENVISAGERRLEEELGMRVALNDIGCFHYNAHFSNGLSENEIDHVLVGTVQENTVIQANANEVHTFKWIMLDTLKSELRAHPDKFTAWLGQAIQFVEENF